MTATIADAYQDYDDLLQDLQTDQTVASTVYEKIMEKEENRINLINRVIDHKLKENIKKTIVLNSTLSDIVRQTVSTWWEIYNDILHKKTTDPLLLFWEGDRKMFTGVFIVMIALVLFFVDITA
jgi:hypothetical protein